MCQTSTAEAFTVAIILRHLNMSSYWNTELCSKFSLLDITIAIALQDICDTKVDAKSYTVFTCILKLCTIQFFFWI